MINKLLLVRTAYSRPTLIEEAGMVAFVKDKELPISPAHPRWSEEDGLTHYGWSLYGLSLGDWKHLQEWAGENEGTSLHTIDEGQSVEEVLSSVGLQINKAA